MVEVSGPFGEWTDTGMGEKLWSQGEVLRMFFRFCWVESVIGVQTTEDRAHVMWGFGFGAPCGVRLGLAAGLIVGLFSGAACAEIKALEVSRVELPEAPGFGAQAAQTGTAVVSGTVLDLHGAAVAGAKVTVSGAGTEERVIETKDDGRFEFKGLGAERVTVTITASGLDTFVSNEIRLSAGEKYELPKIALPVAPENSSVNVTVTEDELATAEVKQQEKQRVLGVLPNFYTSYLWDAAPMRKKQKFHLMVKSSLDPEVFVVSGLRAGGAAVSRIIPGIRRWVCGVCVAVRRGVRGLGDGADHRQGAAADRVPPGSAVLLSGERQQRGKADAVCAFGRGDLPRG